MTVIYHNPRCSKSRCGIEYLQNKGIAFEIVRYLDTPLNAAELTDLVAKLGISPEQLVRKSEDLYKTTYKGKQLSDSEWIEVLALNPVLIERPIVVHNERAVVARPTERIDEILG
jgi:arsenate reductase (glutaredoxin)